MPRRGLLLFKEEPMKPDRQKDERQKDGKIDRGSQITRKFGPHTRWSEVLRPGQGERLHRRRTMTFCTE